MSNQYLDIEAFARLSGLSVNTVRRKIKTLSETDKKAYIQYVPIVGRGGQKIMLDKALINHWVINGDAMSNQETEQNPIDKPLSNQEKETIQEQINEPEDGKKQNGSTENNDSSIIEILRGQIEYLQRQSETKDSQINELLERLKESQYNLASMQKQLTAPQEQTPGDVPRWWQFWK